MRLVFNKLRKKCLYTKLKKCSFHQLEVEFLGYIISDGGFSIDPKKVQTIVEWVKPSSVQDVQCFIGFANFYRIFVKDYFKIVTPLTRLTGKSKFIWTPEAGRVFQILKTTFTTAPILLHPDPSKPFFWKQML